MASADIHAELALFQYRDAGGKWRAVWMEATTKKELEKLERCRRRAEAKFRRRHLRLSELSDRVGYPLRDDEMDEAAKRLKAHRREFDDFGSLWEGPRFEFTWLVGESRTWEGEPVVGGLCVMCGEAWLPEVAYCLGCDSSGMDRLIPRPSESELKFKAMTKPKDDGLKGGQDCVQPKAKGEIKKPGLKGGIG